MFFGRTRLLLGVLAVQAVLVDFANDSSRVSSIKLLAYGQITESKSDYETWAHLLEQTVAYIIKRLVNVLHGAKATVWRAGGEFWRKRGETSEYPQYVFPPSHQV